MKGLDLTLWSAGGRVPAMACAPRMERPGGTASLLAATNEIGLIPHHAKGAKGAKGRGPTLLWRGADLSLGTGFVGQPVSPHPGPLPRERERPGPALEHSHTAGGEDRLTAMLPLPEGEGRGEGKRDARNAAGARRRGRQRKGRRVRGRGTLQMQQALEGRSASKTRLGRFGAFVDKGCDKGCDAEVR